MLRQGGDVKARWGCLLIKHGWIGWIGNTGRIVGAFSAVFLLFVIVTSTDHPVRFVSTCHLKRATLAEPCRQHKLRYQFSTSNSRLLTVQNNQEPGWCSVGGCVVQTPVRST